MRFGISTHLYHDQRLSREHLAQIAAHGFEAVEVFATRSHFDYHDPAAIARLAEWLKETGLALHGIHAPIVERLAAGDQWGEPISNAVSDNAKRQAAVREADAALNIARQIPADVFVVHLGTPAAQGGENNRTAAFRSVEEICRLAEPHRHPGGARGDPEPAVGRGVAGRHAREGSRRAADRHLPRLRPRVPARATSPDTIETVAEHLITTHVHDNHGKKDDAPGPVRRADQLGHRADDDAEGRVRRDLPDGAGEHGLAREGRAGAGAHARAARFEKLMAF